MRGNKLNEDKRKPRKILQQNPAITFKMGKDKIQQHIIKDS